MQELKDTLVRSLGQEDPLEKGMATHQYSCLENPMHGGAWWGYSPWGYRESDMTEVTSHTHAHKGVGRWDGIGEG